MKKLSLSGLVVCCTVVLVLLLFWPSVALASQSGDFTYDVKAYGVVITGYTGNNTTVVIPSKINGKPVVSIGDHAFTCCSTIANLTIPDSIRSIGDNAFSYCERLTALTIPNSVISIGYSAFSDCNGLNTVTIPDSVLSIGSFAFNECSELISLSLPRSVIVIGDDAFADCIKLTSLSVNADNPLFSSQSGVLYNKGKTALICYPAGKKGAFIIPGSVTTIKDSAFSKCQGLTAVTIPAKARNIGDYAFLGCTSLTSITIPSGVTAIGDSVFWRCIKLASINVSAANPSFSSFSGVLYSKDKTTLLCYPESKKGAFVIPSSVKTVPTDAFMDCIGLTGITIPSSVTSIDQLGFSCCTNLSSVILPSDFKSISDGLFMDCPKLTSISIPSSVTSIGVAAFSESSGLSKAIFRGDKPNLKEGIFDGAASNFKVYYHISHSSSWARYTDYSAQAYCIIKMNLQNGSAPVKVLTDITNSHIKAPVAPARAGYSLVGWYKDAACTQPWIFSTQAITGDIAVYAKWKAITPAATASGKAVSPSYN